MLFRCKRLVAMAALAASMTLTVSAQTAAPPASAPASSPRVSKPGPRLSTPVEKTQESAMPGELRPEEKVTPQIVVPLRKSAPPSKAPLDPAAQRAASAPGIDDSVARCEAQKSKKARDKCLSTTTK